MGAQPPPHELQKLAQRDGLPLGGNLVKPHIVLGQPLNTLAGIMAGTRQGSMGGMKNPTETQLIMLLYLLFPLSLSLPIALQQTL